ncbi:CDP-alcohol phosphatidyltransferase family protein [Haploplasma axanthum]|nr:CDP-alcohol phosphatidyltransferase family protein [Haploplasma axanthum]
MKKINIPNIVTLIRIILVAVSIFFIRSNHFFIFYILAGLSDVVDGFLARKLKQETILGAQLDSFSDFFLFSITIIWISVNKNELVLGYITILIVLFVIKLIVIFINYFKYKKMFIVHTIGNKALGFLIFLIPVITNFVNDIYYFFVLVFASLVILEELMISIKYNDFNINRKSFFIDKDR